MMSVYEGALENTPKTDKFNLESGLNATGMNRYTVGCNVCIIWTLGTICANSLSLMALTFMTCKTCADWPLLMGCIIDCTNQGCCKKWRMHLLDFFLLQK